MKTIDINGKKYHTCEDFADMIGKDLNTVFTLLSRGNTIRRLNSLDIGGKPLIPHDEYLLYPFTGRGPRSRFRVYHYTEKGDRVPCQACSDLGGDSHHGC